MRAAIRSRRPLYARVSKATSRTQSLSSGCVARPMERAVSISLWLAEASAHIVRQRETKNAAAVARKQASFGVDFRVPAKENGEIVRLRAEVARLRREMDTLLTERRLARGRPFYSR